MGNAYTLLRGRITITGAGTNDDAKLKDEGNKEVISKNCAPIIECTSEKINFQTYHAKDLDIVMSMNQNTAIIIQKYLEVYGNNTEMNQL